MLTPVIALNNSPDMCTEVPLPEEAMLILPISLGVSNELGDGLCRHVGVHHHHIGQQHRPRDRHAVANEVERKVPIERGIDRIVGSDKADRIAVGRRAQRRRHPDVSARADFVFDDLLAQAIRQVLSDDAGHRVVRSAGRERYDPMHWASWIALRPGNGRGGSQHGSACDQL
jgi:hypothetical protein